MRPRMLAVSVAASVTLVAGGTAAYAVTSSPVDSSGVIHACFGTADANGTSHNFALQDAGTPCPANMTAIQWNQAGPAGPQGPEGPAGPSTAGPAGLDVIIVVGRPATSEAGVTCPLSHPYVLGGGGLDHSGGALASSNPLSFSNGVGAWDVTPVNPNDNVLAFALCAK